MTACAMSRRWRAALASATSGARALAAAARYIRKTLEEAGYTVSVQPFSRGLTIAISKVVLL
jgi:hypothetical protein